MRVEIVKKALKAFGKVSEPDRSALKEEILALQSNQHPASSTRLTNTKFYRLRVCNWRVIYHILSDRGVVLILKVARRSEKTYRDL